MTYIAKSKTGCKEKNKSYNQIKMCTCINYGGWNGNSFCVVSLSINSFESLAISSSLFFFKTLWVPFFFSFFFSGPSWVHIFLAHASFFLTITRERERDQHILWSIYFVEWRGDTVLTSHRSIARGYMVCT